MSARIMKLVLVATLTAATAVGVLALFERFGYGIGVANFTSISPWGMWMSIYIYFIGLSAGSFLLSSLRWARNLPRGVHWDRRILSAACFPAIPWETPR